MILKDVIIGHSFEMPLNLCINYHFQQGNIYYIFGNNGSGKTTLMRTLCGYLPIISGDISIKNPFDTNAYYGHDTGLKQRMIVGDYLKFCMNMFENTHYLTELIDIFNLNALLQTSISDLSCGQKKRVSLVALLLCNRDIYCFDEASSGLDNHYKDIFYKYLLHLVHHRNKIILFSDHTNPKLKHQIDFNISDFYMAI